MPLRRSILFVLALSMPLLISAQASAKGEKIAGVSLESPPRVVTESWTESICRINANWVAVQPYAFSYPNDPQVRYNGTRQWWGERTDGARELVQQAHRNHLKVMLKPMVWIPGGWVGSYSLTTEADWQIWEAEYTEYILENALMAQEESVELFCMGTEFDKVVVQRPQFWRKLVPGLRKVYKGPITYAANWDNYQQVRFWDLLDYVGVDAYFPLSPKVVPDVAELKRLWREHARPIELLHRLHDKPVLFTEFGYRSVNACSWRQWEQDHIPYHEGVNLQSQLNAYRAFFEYYWHLDWFAGVFIWKWHTHDQKAGGPGNSDYTPQNKPAEEIICSWFGR